MDRARPYRARRRKLRAALTGGTATLLLSGLAYVVAPASASAAAPATPAVAAAARAFLPLLPAVTALRASLLAPAAATSRGFDVALPPRAGHPRRLPTTPPRAPSSFAHVFTVDTPGDAAVSTPSVSEPKCAPGNSGTCTLRQAVADAGSDTRVDEVVVPSGTQVALSLGSIVVPTSMVIAGTAASVNGGGKGSVFVIGEESAPAVEIDGLLIAGGRSSGSVVGEGGGGILCNVGSLVLSHVDVAANTATNLSGGAGGGIYVGPDCAMWIDDSVVKRNLAIGGGLTAPARGTVAAQGYGFGGGMFVDGSVSVSRSVFEANVAEAGGGIFNNGNTVLDASAVDANSPAAGEPGIGVGVANNDVLSVTASTIDHNASTEGGTGGGLFNDASASLTGSSVSFNSFSGGLGTGCPVFLGPGATICGTGIASTSLGLFGPRFLGGSLTLTDVSLDGNSSHAPAGSDIAGGALFCAGCSLAWKGGSVDGTLNVAPANLQTFSGVVGGALLFIPSEGLGAGPRPRQGGFPSHATVEGVSISHTTNLAPHGEVAGGDVTSLFFDAMFAHDSFSATRNVATEVGGGAVLADEGPLAMSDATISSTDDAASGVATAQGATGGEVLGGAIANFGGLGAMTLQDVSITGTMAVADLGTMKTPSTETSFVGGGAILEIPIEVQGGLVADGLSVTGTTATASGGNGIVAGGAIAAVAGQVDLRDTEVLGATVQADDVVAGGLFANGVSGLVATNLTLGSSSVTVTGGPDATFAPPGIFGAALLNVSGVLAFANASANITNGTVGSVRAVAPQKTYAALVQEVGEVCGGGSCSAGLVQLTNSTLAGNQLSVPRGTALTLSAALGLVALRNSIVTATAPTVACTALAGAIDSGGHNIDTGHSCGFSGPGDMSATDPMLRPLADNGGLVETEALTPPFYGPFVAGSPAIDAGTNGGCPATDARGEIRPQSGTCDIGAYELAAQGYSMTALDGGLFHFGAGRYLGSVVALQHAGLVGPLQGPVVAVAATADHRGYFQAGADGGVFAFGRAHFAGSLARLPLAARIVGIATDATGNGYWTVGAEGRVSAFGDAVYYGSEDFQIVHEHAAGIAGTRDGLGYWLATTDGHVLAFGDAPTLGSPAASGVSLTSPLVAIITTPDGLGYWLVAADGGVFSYGHARYHGSTGAIMLNAPVVAAAATPDGLGYWLFARDGGVFNFGDARYLGSMAGAPMVAAISGAASSNG